MQKFYCISTGYLKTLEQLKMLHDAVCQPKQRLGYGLCVTDIGVLLPVRAQMTNFHLRSTSSGTRSRIQWVPGALSPRANRPGQGVNLAAHLRSVLS